MAKKQRIKKILVEQILDKAKIPYDSIVLEGGIKHQEGVLEQYGLAEQQTYKTLAMIGNVTGPVIGVVPTTTHLDEKKLAAVSGNKKVTLIPTKDLQKTTGYVHGANNPVGIWQTKKFPIYFDNAAKEMGTITVSGGELGRLIRVDAQQLAEFVHGEFADIQTKDGNSD